MTQRGGSVTLTSIDAEIQTLIDEGEITFRWWRSVGDDNWVEMDVPPNQTSINLGLLPGEQVLIRSEIFVSGMFSHGWENSFTVPEPPNIFLEVVLWSIVGIVIIAIVISAITIFVAVVDPFNRKNFIAKRMRT